MNRQELGQKHAFCVVPGGRIIYILLISIYSLNMREIFPSFWYLMENLPTLGKGNSLYDGVCENILQLIPRTIHSPGCSWYWETWVYYTSRFPLWMPLLFSVANISGLVHSKRWMRTLESRRPRLSTNPHTGVPLKLEQIVMMGSCRRNETFSSTTRKTHVLILLWWTVFSHYILILKQIKGDFLYEPD